MLAEPEVDLRVELQRVPVLGRQNERSRGVLGGLRQLLAPAVGGPREVRHVVVEIGQLQVTVGIGVVELDGRRFRLAASAAQGLEMKAPPSASAQSR